MIINNAMNIINLDIEIILIHKIIKGIIGYNNYNQQPLLDESINALILS